MQVKMPQMIAMLRFDNDYLAAPSKLFKNIYRYNLQVHTVLCTLGVGCATCPIKDTVIQTRPGVI